MKIYYKNYLKEYAKELRNNSTKSEIFLWQHLKGKKLRGYQFTRQKPIAYYIADFFCNKLRLAVELDGYTHEFEETIEKDKKKEKYLNKLGISVLRFTDYQVYNDMGYVLRTIEGYILEFEQNTPPTPLDRGE